MVIVVYTGVKDRKIAYFKFLRHSWRKKVKILSTARTNFELITNLKLKF